MIFRLLLLLTLPVLAYFTVQSLQQRFIFTRRQSRILFLIVAALLVIGILILLGRLPIGFILAPIGAAGAFVLRFLPTLLRLLPMWQMFRGVRASAKPQAKGQTSTIRTEYLVMELDHDTGDMDGLVLKGSFTEKQLSSLSFEQLMELYEDCQSDSDSEQVLRAYIQRNNPEWEEKYQEGDNRKRLEDDTFLDHQLAIEILGLIDPIDKENVIKAHRLLMQKIHPDRGGSDYLAKKIKLAKDFLINELHESN